MATIRTGGQRLTGPCGTAAVLEFVPAPDDPADWLATVATWWLHCPGQSPGWDTYLLSVVHLRPIDGAHEAVINVAGASHEVVLAALNPALGPVPNDNDTWQRLTPLNVVEQVQLPDDDTARELAALTARGVVDGTLWAEPPLSGQREPWHTSLIKTCAHLRGEVHAP